MSLDQLTEVQFAMQQGDRTRARRLLSQVLLSDRHNEQAWLMMARLVDSQTRVIECLEWALKINPDNASTQAALRLLKRQLSTNTQVYPSLLGVPGQAEQAIAMPRTAPAGVATFEKLISLPKTDEKEVRIPHHKTNWALIFGTLIVFLVILIAVIGPRIALQDPMEEHAILQVGKEWFIPPFDAFKVPGYILGSDEFGRDLLSRILYAVRPTLIMVAIVAVVRLSLGTLIGLGAGWFNGRFGRFLDTLISAALSVPILMVALGAIAMLGAEIGLLAFIVGLSINGWGETARFVREQTKIIKGQLYIESAQALGSSTLQILARHVLRQVMPMVWMLFAFEISGTLMVTAGLGFLGYFIGGDIWIEVEDFVSRRTSGAPELGQMLATSWVNLLHPWALVLTGSVIFIAVLGFNLLGDGLRFQLDPEYINRNSPLTRLSHSFSLWFEQSVTFPVSSWFRANRLRYVWAVLALVAIVSGAYLYQTRLAPLINPVLAAVSVPGDQLWASERIDPYGSIYSHQPVLRNPQKLWAISNPLGFSGSPVVSSNGGIYIAGLDATLMAVNPDGSTMWQTSLPEVPLGPLGLGPQGTIYVTDSKGGLSAISPVGTLLWTYSTEALGKPIHGPIIAPDGTIYYLLYDPRGDTLNAVLPDGHLLWSTKPGTSGTASTLRLSPDGGQIFIKNVIVSTLDGSRVDITLPTDNSLVLANKAELFVGADGKTYLLAGHVVMQWDQTSQGFNLVQSAEWDYRSLGFYQASSFPVDGAVTPEGNILLFYTGYYGATRVVWLDPTGRYIGDSQSHFYQGTNIVAVDREDVVILCGVGATDQGAYTAACGAYMAGDNVSVWDYSFGADIDGIVGAAMAPGRLYVVTGDGILTALGDPSSVPTVPAVTP